MVSKASEDLPEPERPVKTTSLSRGIAKSTFFRLCSRAPRITIARPSKGFPGAIGGAPFRARPDEDAEVERRLGAGSGEPVTRPEPARGLGVFIDPVEMWQSTAPAESAPGVPRLPQCSELAGV